MTKKLSLAFLTKDRVHLSERSIVPLLHDDIDLWVIDGSRTEDGQGWAEEQTKRAHVHVNVTGGADSAIVHALTTLLNETSTPYVGLCENDVLLHPGWVGPTLALFERAASEGLLAGAASARCYSDRVLAQRDGYALCHNLGAGHVVFTRKSARLILDFYRTHWSTNNVKVFYALSGIDIRKYWAFRGAQQALTGDWGFDTILAAHGLASVALTPTDVEMIGQDTPLAEQGLELVREPIEMLRNDLAFDRFAAATHRIRKGEWRLPDQTFMTVDDGSQIIFPHQVAALADANEHGTWRMKWTQGFGPFTWVADPQEGEPPPTIEVPIAGPCAFIASGGEKGGRVTVTDLHSGYEASPDLQPEGPNGQTLQLAVPGSIAWRTIRLTAHVPGVRFYGIKVNEPQPRDPRWTFDHSVLPRP